MLPAVLLGFALVIAARPGPVRAAEAFRWIGDDGTVHFSDAPPADDTIEVTRLQLVDSATDYDPVTDPYSILNQARRIHETWQDVAARRPQRTAPPAATAAADAGRPAPYRVSGGLIYPALPPDRPPYRPSGLARQQARALDALDLTGERPYSINAGAHSERVQRSQALPLVPAGPRQAIFDD